MACCAACAPAPAKAATTQGQRAARATIAALRRGRHVGILVDQKLNEGIAAPFFGATP